MEEKHCQRRQESEPGPFSEAPITHRRIPRPPSPAPGPGPSQVRFRGVESVGGKGQCLPPNLHAVNPRPADFQPQLDAARAQGVTFTDLRGEGDATLERYVDFVADRLTETPDLAGYPRWRPRRSVTPCGWTPTPAPTG